jgi:hypothetical protein
VEAEAVAEVAEALEAEYAGEAEPVVMLGYSVSGVAVIVEGSQRPDGAAS